MVLSQMTGWWSATMAAARSLGPESRHGTLDQIRADLSHEMAAKLARIAGLVREWRAQRFRDSDHDDVLTVLADVARLHKRHARAASATAGTFLALARALAAAVDLRSTMVGIARRRAAPDAMLERTERQLTALIVQSRALVEALSAHHGVRFSEIVIGAAEEIRRECESLGASGVAVEIDSADGGSATWVPRRDAPRWSDLIRNLIRNAAQATHERQESRTPDDVTPPVTVKIRSLPGHGGACVEILDEGVGMDARQADAMWRSGFTRHGPGHGQGLTAEKRAFLEERAALEVRSVRGVGTCVRLELPPRDVPIRPPRRWASPPLAVPTLLLVAILIAGGLYLLPHKTAAARLTNLRQITGYDRRGHVVWMHTTPDDLTANFRSRVHADSLAIEVRVPPLQIRDGGGALLTFATTRTYGGPGQLIAIDDSGHKAWSKPLTWTPPRTQHTGRLMSIFQAESIWNPSGQRVMVMNVRDDNWSSTATQFLLLDGTLMGEYLHPGHLEFIESGDFDNDGRTEILMNGKNNDAAHDARYWQLEVAADAYIECLAMLESPHVGGQAFPYTRWEHADHAAEEAYLLIPPLTVALLSDPHRSEILRINVGTNGAQATDSIEMFIADGRIYTLDRQLRPVSCSVGDHTPAARLAPIRPAAPLLYFHDGNVEAIDLEARRGS